MTTNDAAERLRAGYGDVWTRAEWDAEFDAALAAEYQRGYVEGHGAGEVVGYAAGVERERERIRVVLKYRLLGYTTMPEVVLDDILDAEAER